MIRKFQSDKSNEIVVLEMGKRDPFFSRYFLKDFLNLHIIKTFNSWYRPNRVIFPLVEN